jgi:HPt (histidine-containing phosphotransfer) domain-containing protein
MIEGSNVEKPVPGARLYSLNQLDTDDPDFIRTIVEMFVTNTPESIRLIREAFLSGDREALRHYAHKLKPHFSLFGDNAMHQALQHVEDAAQGKVGMDDLGARIEHIATTADAMVKQLHADILGGKTE